MKDLEQDHIVSVRMPIETWRAMRVLAAHQDKTVSGMLRDHAERLTAAQTTSKPAR